MLPPLPANVLRARADKAPAAKFAPEVDMARDGQGRLLMKRPLAVLDKPSDQRTVPPQF